MHARVCGFALICGEGMCVCVCVCVCEHLCVCVFVCVSEFATTREIKCVSVCMSVCPNLHVLYTCIHVLKTVKSLQTFMHTLF